MNDIPPKLYYINNEMFELKRDQYLRNNPEIFTKLDGEDRYFTNENQRYSKMSNKMDYNDSYQFKSSIQESIKDSMQRMANQSDGFKFFNPHQKMNFDKDRITYSQQYEEDSPIIDKDMIQVTSVPFKGDKNHEILLPKVHRSQDRVTNAKHNLIKQKDYYTQGLHPKDSNSIQLDKFSVQSINEPENKVILT